MTKANQSAPTNRSHQPRFQCGDCRAWQTRTGCGWLDAGTPCGHSVERHRFDQEAPLEEDTAHIILQRE